MDGGVWIRIPPLTCMSNYPRPFRTTLFTFLVRFVTCKIVVFLSGGLFRFSVRFRLGGLLESLELRDPDDDRDLESLSDLTIDCHLGLCTAQLRWAPWEK
eukprot:1381670-Amorphochlora_amoeboformis.AAC.2